MKVLRQNIRESKIVGILLGIIIFSFFFFHPCVAQAEESKEVLILNSYHRGFTWNDSVTEGLIEKLNSGPFKVNISVEYMDWKNYPTKQNLINFYQNIKYKYSKKHFDLIITSDDAATYFALQYRKNLFPRTPIVFCGLYKDVALKIFEENMNITGVIEDIDSEGTIRAALKVIPSAKNVYVLHDRTESGYESLEEIKQAVETVDRKLKVKSLDNIKFNDPASLPDNLPKDSILILTTYFRDQNGVTDNAENVVRFLGQKISQPIFYVYEMGIGKGVIGGSLLSPKLHGMKTAELALRVLKGEDASITVPYQGNDSILLFDNQVLKRFGIALSTLPKGSKIINLPVSFYQRYKELVWITLTIFAAMLMFIAILLLNIYKRKRAEEMLRNSYEELNYLYEEIAATEESLRYQYDELEESKSMLEKSEKKYRKVFETASNGLIIFNHLGIIVNVNPAACSLYGYDVEEFIGKAGKDIIADEFYGERIFHKVFEEIDEKGFFKTETLHKKKNGQLITVEMSAWEFDTEENYYLTILRDITESKKTEMRLRRSEERYKLVFRASNEGLWDHDLVTGENYFSGEWYRNFGFGSNHPVTLNKFYNLVHPDDKLLARKVFSDIKRGKIDKYEIEIRVQDINSEYKWVLAKGIGLRNQKGELVRLAGSHQDIHLRKVQEERIKQLAYFDEITNLPNRASFYEWLGKKLGKSNVGAIFFIDLDNFKIINDTFGHLLGDKLLREVGQKFNTLPIMDGLAARLGGDEFVLAVDSLCNLKEINKCAQSILDIFKDSFFLDGNELAISASIGVALYPNDGTTIDQLLKKADSAMYKAKKFGKNNFALFDESIEEELYTKMLLSNKLRGAMEREELALFYQPQLDISTNKICGLEALIRWISPEYGLIPPVQFIGLAEETGQITAIGEWVLKETCYFAAAINQNRKEKIVVSANISSVQLMQRDFVNTVQKILEETGLDPHLLGLEITESILMESFASNAQKLELLKDIGVKVSLDDFGTGYSSLNYLRQLPINILKIDKTFVDDIIEDQKVKYLTESIVEIAHNMGFGVVAEGVETKEQLDLLAKCNCDVIQGYLISKPLPEKQILELINI